MSEPRRTRSGLALDNLLKRWVDVVHSQKTFTIALNGPSEWKSAGQVDLSISLNFKKPVLLRFVLSDQPARLGQATLNAQRSDYVGLKHLYHNQDFLFILIRKNTGVAGGFRTLPFSQLSQGAGLRECLGLRGNEMLLQPDSPNQGVVAPSPGRAVPSPDRGVDAAAAAAAAAAASPDALAAAANAQSFVENFRVLCLDGDLEDNLAKLQIVGAHAGRH